MIPQFSPELPPQYNSIVILIQKISNVSGGRLRKKSIFSKTTCSHCTCFHFWSKRSEIAKKMTWEHWSALLIAREGWGQKWGMVRMGVRCYGQRGCPFSTKRPVFASHFLVRGCLEIYFTFVRNSALSCCVWTKILRSENWTFSTLAKVVKMV